jgi:hypothetical protein
MKSMWWKLFKTQASTIEAAIDPWFASRRMGLLLMLCVYR